MPSTYTTNGGIELIATGEQSGTWGDTTNTNLQIIDRLTNGVGSITLSGTTHTLTTTDGTLSDGQYAVLLFGGSPSGTNTVTISPNDGEHVYIVKNNSGESVVLTQGSGGNVTVADGKSAIVYANGGGASAAVVDITSTFVPAGALLAANNLSDLANAATARTNLGLGTDATGSNLSALTNAATARTNLGLGTDATGSNLSSLTNTATARTNLGVAIGTNVLAYDANLQSFVTTFTLPTVDGTTDQVLSTNGSGTLGFSDPGATVAQAKGYAVAFSIVFGA